MITRSNLIITKHASDKMIIEGISIDQICEAINKGSKFKQTEGYLAVYTYFTVAYKIIENKYKIKTVFLNRS